MKPILFPSGLAALALCCVWAVSCKSDKSAEPAEPHEDYSEARVEMEAEAQEMLADARRQMDEGRCDAAKQTIEQMREDCYLALSARAEAILLMDSIDLRKAKDELIRQDSLMQARQDSEDKAGFDEACRKVQFYERKLQFDKERAQREE